MSVLIVAEFLDSLADAGHANLRETASEIIVSGVDASATKEIARLIPTGFQVSSLTDAEGNAHEIDDLAEDFSPFRLVIQKPNKEGEIATLRVVTIAGFREFLHRPPDIRHWEVARLPVILKTWSCVFFPWDDDVPEVNFHCAPDPHNFVRNLSRERSLCNDIGLWIMEEWDNAVLDNEVGRVWVHHSCRMLLPALAEEISADGSCLHFGGAPRLSADAQCLWSTEGIPFNEGAAYTLHSVAKWVYENSSQASMRHGLFGADFARVGLHSSDVCELFEKFGRASFDSARIAYQFGLSELSGATFKLLSDLRSLVTGELQKGAEFTRHLMLSLAGALALGIGLIAAKIQSGASDAILVSLMAVATIYVVFVALIGIQFVWSQRSGRRDWKAHLYRFLPEADYENMVSKPLNQAVRMLGLGICLSIIALGVLWWGLLSYERPDAMKPADILRSSSPATEVSSGDLRDDNGDQPLEAEEEEGAEPSASAVPDLARQVGDPSLLW